MLIPIYDEGKQAMAIRSSRLKADLYDYGYFADCSHFWKPQFMFYIWYILNFIEKLGFKTKNTKNNLVKKQIRHI